MTGNQNIADTIRQALSEVRSMADSQTIIGEPIVVGETTLIPVSKVSIGVGIGGGTYGKETANKEKANPSAVGDRPYARGRNYKPDRFNKNYVPEPEDVETIMPEESAEALPAEAEGTASDTPIVETDVITAGEIGSEAVAEDKE